MTLIADTVATFAGQRCGIDHRPETLYMIASRSMTPLAPDARLQERVAGKAIRCAALRRLHPARMAEQARGVDRAIQLHFANVRVSGRHVPCALPGVIVDRRLIQKAVDRKQERAAARVRADRVLQLFGTVKRARRRTIVRQDGGLALTPNLIRDPGRPVVK